MEMTKKALVGICKEHELYRTPELNEKLYCNFKGFKNLTPALAAYINLRALFLEGNVLETLEGMPNLDHLKCLFVQQNLLADLVGIERLPVLDTLNISNNRLEKLDSLSECKALTTLIASGNLFKTKEDIHALGHCETLVSIDLQNNKLSDVEIVEIFARLPNLRCLYLKGNDVVNKFRNYRKSLVSRLQSLTYLDDRPVFEAERRMAEAWASGGVEAERFEREKIKEEEKERDRVNFEYLQKIRKEGWRKKREALGLPPGDTDPYFDFASEDETSILEESEELKEVREEFKTALSTFPNSESEMEAIQCNEDARVYLESVKQNQEEMITEYKQNQGDLAHGVESTEDFTS